MAGSIILETMRAVGQPDKDQDKKEEDINWQAPIDATERPKPSRPTITYDKSVYIVQKRLKRLGYYDGELDGLKGSGTTAAIKKWEENYTDQVDGTIDDKEMKRLSALVLEQYRMKINSNPNTMAHPYPDSHFPPCRSKEALISLKGITEDNYHLSGINIMDLNNAYEVPSNYSDIYNGIHSGLRRDRGSRANL